MSDRKYRQHGYQDRDDERNKAGGAPKPRPSETFGPRQVNMAPACAISRCTQCGVVLPAGGGLAKCPKCAFELHSCKQCAHFDPASRFECRQPIKERVARKDVMNTCTLYTISVRVERETSSSRVPAAPSRTPGSGSTGNRLEDARRAFDALFKK